MRKRAAVLSERATEDRSSVEVNPRHVSDSVEHFTPDAIVEAARATLGVIHLDPASTTKANERIKARRFFTQRENGYLQEWSGNVFLNPPGGFCDKSGQRVIKDTKSRPNCSETGDCGLFPGHKHWGVDSSQKLWWQALATHWVRGRVEAAIFVCFSVELLQSTQVDPIGPLPLEFPICFPSRRVQYLRPDWTPGTSPPHASCIVCLTDDEDKAARFRRAFESLGHVMIPIDRAMRQSDA